MKKLYLLILVLIPFAGNTQNIYVDAVNISGVEDGTLQHPFNTIEEGITSCKTGDTIFINSGNYLPSGGELFLKPGTILFGENQTNTIINADIRDTARSELPFEIHNLTFGEFICSRGNYLGGHFSKPCLIRHNICREIAIAHGGGYIENGDEYIFKPIPFFHIENNEVTEEISFAHGAGQIVGNNIVMNNKAGSISLKHGAVTSLNEGPKPEYAYLIEGNSVSEGIECNQGGSPNFQYPDSVVKDYTVIKILTNKADFIELKSGAGYTYLVDNNIAHFGISDKSGGNWTTISNNTITHGRIVDASGGTSYLENQIIKGNTIHFEATGDPDEDYAIIEKGSSATILNNKIKCTGAASGIQMYSGFPSNITGNEIEVDPEAEYGINSSSGAGVVTGNKITGGKIGYYSRSGVVLFENNNITGSHWGFFSKGTEEVKNNTITNCTGHGMVLDGLRGPISGNTVTDNDSTGIWVIREVDLGGGIHNGVGKNIIRGNGYYDMRISINAVTPDTLFINNNVWDHETIEAILEYDILNESTGGNLLLDFNSIIAKPATVQLASPGNQAVLTSRPAQLVWHPVENADNYRLQISTDEVFRTILFDTLLTAVTFLPVDLPNQTDYYWRVLAVNQAGEGNWSETRKFSTLITGLHDTEIGKNGIIVYPNPTTGKFKVQCSGFKIDRSEVVDLNGKILEILKPQETPNEMSFDIGHFPSGVYVIKVFTHDTICSRLVLLK